MPSPIQIPANRAEIVDKKTTTVSREWYRFFLSLLDLASANQYTSFNYTSTGQIASGSVYNIAITGVDCVNGNVNVTAWGDGENTAADAYLVGYTVTSRTTTGCTVNVKNLGASSQTLNACIVVTL